MVASIVAPPPASSQFSATSSQRTQPVFSDTDFALLLAAGGVPSSSDSSSILDVADTINLSSEARNLLDFFNNAAEAFSGNGVLDNNTIILTDAQQAQLNAILAQFKDAPFAPDTFNRILEKLNAAGLSPEQVVAQQAASPLSLSSIFLRALSPASNDNNAGDDVLALNNTSIRDARDAYIRQIFVEWERISTQFQPFLIANFVQPPTTFRRNVE